MKKASESHRAAKYILDDKEQQYVVADCFFSHSPTRRCDFVAHTEHENRTIE